MCTLKEASEGLGISQDTLKFYCKAGLVPNVRRDKNNYRDFDERNLRWIKSVLCLRRCGLGIEDIREYLALCLEGRSSIPQRKEILARRRALLEEEIAQMQKSLRYIDDKQRFFDDIAAGKIPYTSNLIETEGEEAP